MKGASGGAPERVRLGERDMQKRRDHLNKAMWTLADQGIVSAGNFLLNIQLARHLPVSEYGVFALLFGGVFLLQHFYAALLLYPLGLRIAAMERMRDEPLTSLTLAMVAVVNLAFAALVAAVMTIAGRPDIALEAAAFSFMWQMQDAVRRILMAEFRHRTAIFGDAISYFGQALVVAVLIYANTLTLPQALLAMGCASLVGGLIQLRQLQLPWPDFKGVDRIARQFWQSGKWALASGLPNHLRLQILPWTLGLMYGSAAAAALQAALNIANLTNPVLFGLCGVISQGTARAQATGGEAAWKVARLYVLIGAAFFVAYGTAVIAAPTLVSTLFYGDHSVYANNQLTVRIVMAAVVVNFFADAFSAFLYGLDQGRLAWNISLVGLLVAAAGCVMTLPWAVDGAALAMLAANLARVVASVRCSLTMHRMAQTEVTIATPNDARSQPRSSPPRSEL